VRFIHNGVDIGELNSPRRAESPYPGKYLLCIAAMNRKKGLEVLIEAFSLLKDDEEEISLVLVEMARCEGNWRIDQKAGIARTGFVLGEKGRPEVVTLLHSCEMLVLPSRAEPFAL